ncbi:type IV pilus twitching motility protein PilT [Anaerotalea alkaliphila]|uniref:Type IV pilus twitching motility protein PilT n=1 Tax=Anaerotalea alkaliphila TaxID=2662126 RepID=A0A7X5KLY5_9FIRM|nr:type IV pilus twitching motility protein PilT [Anaerotalea alkaliphila]NDL66168.1 type IV pilus twitching motility protein PilT [Anaerotalea alkaliphila]
MSGPRGEELLVLLLEKTVAAKGTDLHLCAGSRPMMRVRSRLAPVEGMERMGPREVEDLVCSQLNPERLERLKRQKSIDFSYSKSNLGRFRCNVYLQRGTYAMAIRTLPLEIPRFETLGLPPVVKGFTARRQGLVLVTGATGSGKSTTLASLLDVVNAGHPYHVVTIEDPIEYLHRHKSSMVTQREVGEDANSFASALKAALREDPDVIMVGEMRDLETISIALTAAETGHLVLSTLHTGNAVKAIDRIVDVFPTDQQNQVRSQLASVLEGIVSQQLVPGKEEGALVLAAEVMVATPAVRNLIREGKHHQVNGLIQTGSKHGMVCLERSLADLCLAGKIDREEAAMKAHDLQLLESFLQRG